MVASDTAAEITQLVAVVTQLIKESDGRHKALQPYRRSLHDTTLDDFDPAWVLYDPPEATRRIYIDEEGQLIQNGVFSEPITVAEIDELAASAVVATLRYIVDRTHDHGWRRYIPRLF